MYLIFIITLWGRRSYSTHLIEEKTEALKVDLWPKAVMASWWQKLINSTRTVPPRRNVGDATGSVARKNAKKVLERFLVFPEQWDFSSLVNPVRRHWHQKKMAIPRKRWQFPEKKEMWCFPAPSATAVDVGGLDSPESSGVRTPPAAWIRVMYIFCYFRFFGQITPLEQSREKGPLAFAGLMFVVGDFTVTAWEACELAVCWGHQFKSHKLAGGSTLTPQCDFLLWNLFSGMKRWEPVRKGVFQHSVRAFRGQMWAKGLPDNTSFNPINNPIKWPLP